MNEAIFNETMQGYVMRALKGLKKELGEEGYTEYQIAEIEDIFLEEFKWAKDEMTLEQARVYRQNF